MKHKKNHINQIINPYPILQKKMLMIKINSITQINKNSTKT